MFIVQIAGNLGRDPETRVTPTGLKVTNFTVAVNQRRGKDKEEVTIWVKVVVWGDRFDKMLSFLKKGSSVIVTGRMNPPTTYVDKEGRTQYSLEITAEMLDFSPFGRTDRPEGNASYQEGQQQPQQYAAQQAHSNNTQQTQSKQHSHYTGKNATGQGAAPSYSQEEDELPF